MKFPLHKYNELSVSKRNTLQVFITNRCNLKCDGCFARHVMVDDKDMSLPQYAKVVDDAVHRGVKQINLLGGEPFLHPAIYAMIAMNNASGIKTTIYTNGTLLNKINPALLQGAKLRVSIYSLADDKGINLIKKYDPRITFDANFMVGGDTSVPEMLAVARVSEEVHGCKVFFIFSMRECDNDQREFFRDTEATGTTFDYKRKVHEFMERYTGKMDIHVSKRGVFESTVDLPCTKCNFANVFVDGRIIQCPFDVATLQYQDDYEFGTRHCQQNSTCLMSKVVYRPLRSPINHGQPWVRGQKEESPSTLLSADDMRIHNRTDGAPAMEGCVNCDLPKCDGCPEKRWRDHEHQ